MPDSATIKTAKVAQQATKKENNDFIRDMEATLAMRIMASTNSNLGM